jgi:hypothetical protein
MFCEEEKRVQGFGWKARGKKTTWKTKAQMRGWDQMDLREIGWGGGDVEWIHLAQDRVRWRAVVNAVMNLRVLAPRS